MLSLHSSLLTLSFTMTATSYRLSTAFFHAPPLCSPHARISSMKSVNSRKTRNLGVVQAKLPNYSTKAALYSSNLGTIGVPTSVPVRVAYELFLAGHRYLDVRTPEEFNDGHAPGAVNIPYMYRDSTGMYENPDFIAEVSEHFRKDAEIIVGCQLGKRSMMAASDLEAAGFTGVTNIAGGYAAWTENGLPTEL